MSRIRFIAPAAALLLAASSSMATETSDFDYTVDRFADIEVLRYRVPGFEELSLDQKRLIYYLTEAALWGRDILWDQNYRYNLPLRHMLEAVYTGYTGDRDDKDFRALETYLKQIWFANGIHTTTTRWTSLRRASAAVGSKAGWQRSPRATGLLCRPK